MKQILIGRMADASTKDEFCFSLRCEKEKRRALEKAAREGEEVFNICPICRRLICNECFLICDDLDLCRACALRLGEAGEPVSGKSNETEHVRKTTAALK